MVKDNKCLNVINVRTKQSRVILKNAPFRWDVIRTYLMDFGPYNHQDKSITFYNTELESRTNGSSRELISSVKKFTIDIDCLDSCF